MKEVYLSKETKEYYYNDFIENVIPETNPSWKLSEYLKPILYELNSCERIQPLYSQFPDARRPSSEQISYLRVAYFEELELPLFRDVLSFFTILYKDSYSSKFYFTFHDSDVEEPFHAGDPKIKMGCFSNPDFFKINYIMFWFKSEEQEKHREFWEKLRNRLSTLH